MANDDLCDLDDVLRHQQNGSLASVSSPTSANANGVTSSTAVERYKLMVAELEKKLDEVRFNSLVILKLNPNPYCSSRYTSHLNILAGMMSPSRQL